MTEKIVRPEDLQFEDQSIVSAVTPSLDAVAAGAATSTSSSRTYAEEQMAFLADRCADMFQSTVPIVNGTVGMAVQYTFGNERTLFPKSIYLTRTNSYMKIEIQGIDNELLKKFIISNYGEHVAESGLFEHHNLNAPGLTTDDMIASLAGPIPELKSLAFLAGRYLPLTANPWIPVMSAPVKYRAIFTGALRDINASISKNNSPVYVKPLTFKDMLEQAKKAGDVGVTMQHWNVYSDL